MPNTIKSIKYFIIASLSDSNLVWVWNILNM